jgi:hypothetical protein
MANNSYFDENWLRCLGDYRTECDGSQKLGQTICDSIIELNGTFEEYNEDDKPAKKMGFKFGRFIYLGKSLDDVIMAVKDYLAKLESGNVNEVIPLGFWTRAINYQWVDGQRLGDDLEEMRNVLLATEKFPDEIDGRPTKTVHDLELWIREGVNELRALLRTIRGITSNLPNSCYGKIYEMQSENLNAEPVQRYFDWWMMNIDEVNLENLLALQFRVLTDFANSGILRFSAHQDLEGNPTMFVKTATRVGYIYHINRNVYGKYICQHILEFEPHERMAVYQVEKLLKLIRQKIQNLPPEELKKAMGVTEETNVSTSHSESRKRILQELCDLADKGDWARGVTSDDVKAMLYSVLGFGEKPLEGSEADLSEQLWQLLENGRGDRVKIVWQNMVGYLDDRKTLKLKGGPALNKDFFGTEESYSNIDKGRPSRENCSSGFREVISLLDSYVPKV